MLICVEFSYAQTSKDSLAIEEQIVTDLKTGQKKKIVTETKHDDATNKTIKTVKETIINDEPVKKEEILLKEIKKEEPVQEILNPETNPKTELEPKAELKLEPKPEIKPEPKPKPRVKAVPSVLSANSKVEDENTLATLKRLVGYKGQIPDDISAADFKVLLWAAEQYYKILTVTNKVGEVIEYKPYMQFSEPVSQQPVCPPCVEVEEKKKKKSSGDSNSDRVGGSKYNRDY